MYFGTWNVNGQDPSEPLNEWLIYKDSENSPAMTPDIYCIGFQELDLSASALMLGDKSQASPWALFIEKALSNVGDYVLLKREQLVGILLCVYVKCDLPVSNVQTGIIPAGIMGVMGNKGGVAVRFSAYESTFCIVNSHLNAGQENVVRRNQDFNDIARSMYFTLESGESMGVFDHDYLFWMGDLNYRINGVNEEIRAKVKNGEFDELILHDQLKEQQRLGNAFVGFSEAKIAFCPTYKYDKNSNNYVSLDKGRSPAWCDRILWRAREGGDVSCLRYTRHELLSSDHRPVSGCFRTKIRTFVRERRAQIYQELLRTINATENDLIPEVQLSTKEFSFGDVHFMVPCVRQLTLHNVGKGIARWSFIPKPNEKETHKPWMFITPSSGALLAGETASIRLTLVVDSTVSVDLSTRAEMLEDLLVLHVDRGKDYFISINGSYIVSCFGLSLPILVHCTEPVRETNIAVAAVTTARVSGDSGLGIPKELWRIADFLYRRRAFSVPGIFQQGSMTIASPEALFIRECLDTGKSFETHMPKPRNMADAFIQFLDSLSSPVIPYDLFQACIDASSSPQSAFLFVTTRLHPVHYATFFYVVAIAKELLLHSKENGIIPERLAFLLASVMIKPKNFPSKKVETIEKKRADFILYFIVDNYSLQRLPFPSAI